MGIWWLWFGGGRLGHGDTSSSKSTYIEELKNYGAKVTQVSLKFAFFVPHRRWRNFIVWY